MAATTTILSWGLLRYKDAYTHSGQLDNMYDCIRWSLEWLLKCHTGTNELYVQVSKLVDENTSTYLINMFRCRLKYFRCKMFHDTKSAIWQMQFAQH